MRLAPLLLAAVVTTVASACAAPLQQGGVEVRPNAEARLEVMCRYRTTDAEHVCAEPDME